MIAYSDRRGAEGQGKKSLQSYAPISLHNRLVETAVGIDCELWIGLSATLNIQHSSSIKNAPTSKYS